MLAPMTWKPTSGSSAMRWPETLPCLRVKIMWKRRGESSMQCSGSTLLSTRTRKGLGVLARWTRDFYPLVGGTTRKQVTKKIFASRPKAADEQCLAGVDCDRPSYRTGGCLDRSNAKKEIMKLEVLDDADSVARTAAATIAAAARAAIASRGRFSLAVSGGHTPWIMLRELAGEDLPWASVHLFQVDERIAPAGNPDRNLTHLRESLLQHVPVDLGQIHAMPVEAADLQDAANQYASELRTVAGSPAV